MAKATGIQLTVEGLWGWARAPFGSFAGKAAASTTPTGKTLCVAADAVNAGLAADSLNATLMADAVSVGLATNSINMVLAADALNETLQAVTSGC